MELKYAENMVQGSNLQQKRKFRLKNKDRIC